MLLVAWLLPVDLAAAQPYSIAVNPGVGLVYFSHNCNNRTALLDAATRGLTQLVAGLADRHAGAIAADEATHGAVATGPRIHAVYVANHAAGSLTIPDRTGRSAATVSGRNFPCGHGSICASGGLRVVQGLTIVGTELPQDPTRKQTSESLASSNRILP